MRGSSAMRARPAGRVPLGTRSPTGPSSRRSCRRRSCVGSLQALHRPDLSCAVSRIAIGSDHAGYLLKQHLIDVLEGARPRRRRPSAPTARSRSTTRRSAPLSARTVRVGRRRPGHRARAAAARASRSPPTRCAACGPRCATTSTPPGCPAQHNDANVLSMGGRIVAFGLADEILDAVARHRVRGRPPRRAVAVSRDRARRARGTIQEHESRHVRLAIRPATTELFALIDRELERQNTTLQLIASRELHLAGGAARPPARCSPTSTPRATRASATTAATRSSTRSRTSPATGPRRCSAPSTPTCSRTRAPTPTWPCTSRCSSRATRCMGMSLDHGGHLTHGSPVNVSGKLYDFVRLRLDAERRAPRLRPDPRPGPRAPARR